MTTVCGRSNTVFLRVLLDSFLPLLQLTLHAAFYFLRDGQHQVGPDRQAAGRGEEVHFTEQGSADILAKESVDDLSHPGVQIFRQAVNLFLVRDLFFALPDFFLNPVKGGKGLEELFDKAVNYTD